MKTLVALILISGLSLSMSSEPLAARSTDDLTKEEKDYLLDYLKETQKRLLNNIKNLSPAQWHFKESPDRWSIAQCADHIANAEQALLSRAKSLIGTELEDGRTVQTDGMVEKVVGFISEENRKEVKIPVRPGTEPAERQSDLRSPKEYAKYFKQLRGNSIDFVKDTEADLSAYFSPSIPQLGDMNSYLWLVFMSAHSARHTAQIEEIMAHPNFPQ